MSDEETLAPPVDPPVSALLAAIRAAIKESHEQCGALRIDYEKKQAAAAERIEKLKELLSSIESYKP